MRAIGTKANVCISHDLTISLLVIYKNMDESHIHTDKQKKSDTNVFILYDFNIYEAQEQVKLIYGSRLGIMVNLSKKEQ